MVIPLGGLCWYLGQFVRANGIFWGWHICTVQHLLNSYSQDLTMLTWNGKRFSVGRILQSSFGLPLGLEEDTDNV